MARREIIDVPGMKALGPYSQAVFPALNELFLEFFPIGTTAAERSNAA